MANWFLTWVPNPFNGERIFSLTEVLGQLDFYLIPYTKINLNWVNNPNIKVKAIKLLVTNMITFALAMDF